MGRLGPRLREPKVAQALASGRRTEIALVALAPGRRTEITLVALAPGRRTEIVFSSSYRKSFSSSWTS